MNITYKSSENSNLDTFHFFRIYNIFKYLDCDSTYIMLVIYYCSILYKSLVWVLIIREWMRSAIWKNACDRNQKKSQINVEFLHTPRDRIYFVADFLIIYWSQEEYDLDPATLNRMNFAYGIPTAPPLYLVEEAMEVERVFVVKVLKKSSERPKNTKFNFSRSSCRSWHQQKSL